MYLPPGSGCNKLLTVVHHLSDILMDDNHLSNTNDIIIVGDFNLPDIDWDTLGSTSYTSEMFCDFVFNNNLLQLIDQSTHTKGNILDLVFTNISHSIQNVSISPHNHFMESDHNLITFDLAHCCPILPQSFVIPQYVFDFPKADYEGLCSFLMVYDFSLLLSSNNVEFMVLSQKQHSHSYEFLHPKVRLRKHQYPQWFTPELRHLTKCARSVKKRISHCPTNNLKEKLSDLECSLRNKMLSVKSAFETNLINSFTGKQNSKIYNYIRKLSNSNSIPSCVHLESSLATSDQEKAALFNEFFHSVFIHSHFNLPPFDSLSQPPHCIDNACISQLNVLEALQCLTSDKSSGLARIGPKLLKNCALALYIPIHHLFSLSLASHTIPSEWKIHSITPIHKSGDKSLVSNYRPISLLCIISKVLERIIYNRLSKFLLEQNLIYI